MTRYERIEQLRWRHGGVLDADVRSKLSSSEGDYFKAYSGLLTRYMEGVKMDLTAVRAPPSPPGPPGPALRPPRVPRTHTHTRVTRSAS